MGKGGIVKRAMELVGKIVDLVESGRASMEEVEERLADLFARPPREVDLSEMEEALRRRQEDDTKETRIERHEPTTLPETLPPPPEGSGDR